MGKWGNLAKLLVPLGTGILASHGIPLPLDQIINRPKRRRRRRRGSIDYVALATGLRDVLKTQLRDDELEEVDLVIAEIFRLVIAERQEDVEEEEEDDNPGMVTPRRKRRKRKAAKKVKK